MRESAQTIQPSVNKVINGFADRFVHGRARIFPRRNALTYYPFVSKDHRSG